MCVLLVEDDELIRACLTDMMTDAGYAVVGAADGNTAFQLIGADRFPQMVVSDINLGSGMDGFELLATARLWWPEVPALLMSGVATNFTNRCQSDFERFMLKPFTLEAFLRNIVDLAGKPSDLPGRSDIH